ASGRSAGLRARSRPADGFQPHSTDVHVARGGSRRMRRCLYFDRRADRRRGSFEPGAGQGIDRRGRGPPQRQRRAGRAFPGAAWAEIVPALKLDKRIGEHAYLDPGLGISGGNLERDLRTVLTIGRQHGTDTGIIEAWLANSVHRKDWAWRTLRDAVLAKQLG